MSHLHQPLRQSFRQPSIFKYTVCLLTGLVPLSGVILAGIAGPAVAQKSAGAGKAAHGEEIFKTQCIGCHNKQVGDTTPFGPPNLHGIIGNKPPQLTSAAAIQTIKQGKGNMPAFDGKLSTTDISDVVAYLRSQ